KLKIAGYLAACPPERWGAGGTGGTILSGAGKEGKEKRGEAVIRRSHFFPLFSRGAERLCLCESSDNAYSSAYYTPFIYVKKNMRIIFVIRK
ncbi:MAG: hypothetical protein L6275_04700, partial [Candidatus Portnoybacteria bacterium]|nr:hypothetical protein [Candidatus Portnoybacteria bacterium]